MRSIQLVVTGDLERAALHTALAQHFPGTVNGKQVEWRVPRKTRGGGTTKPLGPPIEVYGPMRELARAALAELERGRTGVPADLVIVVDDAEVGNIGNAANVVAHFRFAMDSLIDAWETDAAANASLRQRVRERVSFHLLMPMIEAHFFVVRRSLDLCGVAGSVTPRLVGSDCEQFESADPAWLPTCRAANAERAAFASWWRQECHPKHYLQHLLDRSGAGIYEETSAGAKAALSAAGWCSYASGDGRYARSLFEDLSVWFGVANPMGGGACAPETWPGTATKPGALLLRNL